MAVNQSLMALLDTGSTQLASNSINSDFSSRMKYIYTLKLIRSLVVMMMMVMIIIMIINKNTPSITTTNIYIYIYLYI